MFLNKIRSLISKNNNNDSQSLVYERLQIRTKINKHSNPILISLEECIKDMLESKYREDFLLNRIDCSQDKPDYKMDAEIEYNDDFSKEKNSGFFKNLFSSKKNNSSDIAKNRLDILIKSNGNNNILKRIKNDIEKIVYDKIQLKPENVLVERDYDHKNNEIIKMIITFPE